MMNLPISSLVVSMVVVAGTIVSSTSAFHPPYILNTQHGIGRTRWVVAPSSTYICTQLNTNNENDDDSVNRSNNRVDDNSIPTSSLLPNRRQALAAAASSVLLTTTTTGDGAAHALSLPGIPTPGGSGGSNYRQARRSTAYLVDGTLPPTLVPFKAQREAAILKNIGQGSGTLKSAFQDESLNLNNILKKAVDGSIDALNGLADSTYGKKQGPTFCFLAVKDYEDKADVELARQLLVDLLKPRRRRNDTAVGLACVPRLSGQAPLDAYLRDNGADAETTLVDALATRARVPPSIVTGQLPVLRYAKQQGVPLLALGLEVEDGTVVRRRGLQNVDVARRSQYVLDTNGFIALTQDPAFKLYADRSLLKDWVPIDYGTSTGDDVVKIDGPGDFFAQRILEDEAVASAAARWAADRPAGFMVVVSDAGHVRYLGGANGRIPRVMKFLDPLTPVDDESVTSILLNPTAESTLSRSRFLRLEIGTAPEAVEYQTKIADYLWFSTMPRVNMIPRMMRGQ